METAMKTTGVAAVAVGGSGIGDDTGPLISGYGESGAQWLAAEFVRLNWERFSAWAQTRHDVGGIVCEGWLELQRREWSTLANPPGADADAGRSAVEGC